MKKILLQTLCAWAWVAGVHAQGKLTFLVSVSGASQVPPNGSPYTGSGTWTLTGDTLEGGVLIPYPSLDPIVGSGIFGPALPGTIGPLVYQFGIPPLVRPPEGGTQYWLGFGASFTLTSAQQRDLIDGLYYVNILSAEYPNGELRGQLLPIPEPSTLALLAVGGAVVGLSWLRRPRRRRPDSAGPHESAAAGSGISEWCVRLSRGRRRVRTRKLACGPLYPPPETSAGTMKKILLQTLCAWACMAGVHAQGKLTFEVHVSGRSQVPPNSSPYTGSGTWTLTGDTLEGGVLIPYRSLDPIVGSGIFGPALPGAIGPLVYRFGIPPVVDPPQGGTQSWLGFGASFTLTSAQQRDLIDGLYYMNILSAEYPNGELRGQLLLIPEPSTLALLAVGGAVVGLWGLRARPSSITDRPPCGRRGCGPRPGPPPSPITPG